MQCTFTGNKATYVIKYQNIKFHLNQVSIVVARMVAGVVGSPNT
jgi:hypothetical protein